MYDTLQFSDFRFYPLFAYHLFHPSLTPATIALRPQIVVAVDEFPPLHLVPRSIAEAGLDRLDEHPLARSGEESRPCLNGNTRPLHQLSQRVIRLQGLENIGRVPGRGRVVPERIVPGHIVPKIITHTGG